MSEEPKSFVVGYPSLGGRVFGATDFGLDGYPPHRQHHPLKSCYRMTEQEAMSAVRGGFAGHGMIYELVPRQDLLPKRQRKGH